MKTMKISMTFFSTIILIVASISTATVAEITPNEVRESSFNKSISPTPPIIHAQVERQINQANWTPKRQVDAAINTYKNKFNVPGMSVAIAQNGKIVYAAGFGFADIAKQQKVDSGTVFRLASVSKPITMALTMRQVEKGLSLDKPARFYVPELPAHHTYTVAHLLKRQSGIRHYRGSKAKDCEVPNNPNWKDSSNTQYSTATAATKLFSQDPLMFKPGTKPCYSTHAYTVLGAVLEGSSKKSFTGLVNQELTQGLNLSSLRPEFINQANSKRANIYQDKNDANDKNIPANRDNLSWKYAGGGFESSSVDLAKFGMKVIDGSFLSPQGRQQLGWNSVFTYSGAQRGAESHIRLEFSKGIAIAVLSNQRINLDEDDPNYSQEGVGKLATTISNIINQK
ncbi:serine hydrolase domain-containing protein [Calothrix sp. UHCC 0171]|uniref:serine hydrolase domain-containing protein n=1 Tax=Calothrix sp. UHCC 0171 TaxID=3110245 RepID=UPI002B207180|nr:serine hydrolase domain-containing protein [Calothrix sp. UHCC 0171]MEA5572502.1 serine hydrolase domain-containing protein [Calothrix sp. UHCC 0171]